MRFHCCCDSLDAALLLLGSAPSIHASAFGCRNCHPPALSRRVARATPGQWRWTMALSLLSFITAALDAGVALRVVRIAARHSDPRTTTRYDRAKNNLDRHASYIVTAFVAGTGSSNYLQYRSPRAGPMRDAGTLGLWPFSSGQDRSHGMDGAKLLS